MRLFRRAAARWRGASCRRCPGSATASRDSTHGRAKPKAKAPFARPGRPAIERGCVPGDTKPGRSRPGRGRTGKGQRGGGRTGMKGREASRARRADGEGRRPAPNLSRQRPQGSGHRPGAGRRPRSDCGGRPALRSHGFHGLKPLAGWLAGQSPPNIPGADLITGNPVGSGPRRRGSSTLPPAPRSPSARSGAGAGPGDRAAAVRQALGIAPGRSRAPARIGRSASAGQPRPQRARRWRMRPGSAPGRAARAGAGARIALRPHGGQAQAEGCRRRGGRDALARMRQAERGQRLAARSQQPSSARQPLAISSMRWRDGRGGRHSGRRRSLCSRRSRGAVSTRRRIARGARRSAPAPPASRRGRARRARRRRSASARGGRRHGRSGWCPSRARPR